MAAIRDVTDLAPGGLVPDLSFLLDLPPAEGIGRRARSADRLEAEPMEFHNRVRRTFHDLAKADPGHYLVLESSMETTRHSRAIRAAVRALLPDSALVLSW